MKKSELTELLQPLLGAIKTQCRGNSMRIHTFSRIQCDYHQWNRVFEKTPWPEVSSAVPFGGEDSHWIFKTTLDLPKSMQQGPIRCRVTTGAQDIWNFNNPQFIVFIDGKMHCGLDINHTEFMLPATKNSLEIALYGYCSSFHQDSFLQMEVYPYDEELEAFFYDLSVPYELSLLLDEDSAAYLQLSEVCFKAMCLLDIRSLTSLAFRQSVTAARQYLAGILYSKPWPNPITVAVVGHSHIDVAWLWTLDQTREKVIRSYASVDFLMNRFPSYIFSSSQCQLLDFVKHDAPQLYAKIQGHVKQGQWEVEGGMWVESDCVLTSGESLTRQFLYGKKFIKEEFGHDSQVLWLPDSFGFCATLPQIMKGCGVEYFMTTKLGWNDTDLFPHDTFYWKGLDGSRVLAHMVTTRDYQQTTSFHTTYNGLLNPSQILGTWQRYQDKSLSSTVLHCYGYGDGGGGPTEEMLQRQERMLQGLPGLPAVKPMQVLPFFKTLEHTVQKKQVPSWVGELYLEYHRGTYTTRAKNKRLNRLCENLVMDTEFFCALALSLGLTDSYPHEILEKVWKLILLNQFHDILPGSAIEAVYAVSEKQYTQVRTLLSDLSTQALALFSQCNEGKEKMIRVFNTTGYQRTDLISLPLDKNHIICDRHHTPLPSCMEGDRQYYVCPKVPPKGWETYFLEPGPAVVAPSAFSVKESEVETPYYKLEIQKDGTLSRIYDKQGCREILEKEKRGNQLRLYADYPREYDAWNLGKQGAFLNWDIKEQGTFSLLQDNSLFCTFRIERTFLGSSVQQDITVYAHSPRIDFKTTVDWQEKHLRLRVLFPLRLSASLARYDSAFGTCERANHTNTSWEEARFEVPGHKWVDLSEEGYGVALLSTQSYGYSHTDNCLGLSLLRSPSSPSGSVSTDKGEYSFCYSLLPHQGSFSQSEVVKEGYALHHPLVCQQAEGLACDLPPSFSLFWVDAPNVVVETIKKAEDRNSLIVRMYEAVGTHTTCLLHVFEGARGIWVCNLLEQRQYSLVDGLELVFRPHEIISVELELATSAIGRKKHG